MPLLYIQRISKSILENPDDFEPSVTNYFKLACELELEKKPKNEGN